MSEMTRGEMIRRLDEASQDVLEHLTKGPLGDDERHALARSLIRLLPLVADDLQDQEDKEAASKLLQHHDRWRVEAEPMDALAVSEVKDRTVDESDWS